MSSQSNPPTGPYSPPPGPPGSSGQPYPNAPVPGPPAMGYPTPPPVGYPQPYAVAAPTNRNPALGVIGFLLSTAAIVVGTFSLMPLVALTRAALAASKAGHQMEDLTTDPTVSAAISQGFSIATGLGFAGLIVGIVAAATRRGRGWGVWSIVLAVLGPVIAFTIWLLIALAGSAA